MSRNLTLTILVLCSLVLMLGFMNCGGSHLASPFLGGSFNENLNIESGGTITGNPGGGLLHFSHVGLSACERANECGLNLSILKCDEDIRKLPFLTRITTVTLTSPDPVIQGLLVSSSDEIIIQCIAAIKDVECSNLYTELHHFVPMNSICQDVLVPRELSDD